MSVTSRSGLAAVTAIDANNDGVFDIHDVIDLSHRVSAEKVNSVGGGV
jgi:hypothetical protein